jgi:endoglucanase
VVKAAPHVVKPQRVMLAGHCDQIGLQVTHIDADGFLYVQPIGGWTCRSCWAST